MNHTVQMAGHAIWDFLDRNTGGLMDSLDFHLNVVVAGVAGIFIVRAGMAGSTGQLALAAVIEWKIMERKPGWLPRCILMTHLAALAKKASMDLGLLVAGGANRFLRVEWLASVALRADQFGMLTCQRKDRGVIEACHPVDSVVAFCTSLAKRLDVLNYKDRVHMLMTVLAGVTPSRRCRCRGDMAFRAFD